MRSGRVALVDGPGGPFLELRRLAETEASGRSLPLESSTPPFDGSNLVVGDFSRSNRTPLGGYFGTFQRPPSAATATVEREADGRKALELSCNQEGEGFCGLWIQLYDADAPRSARSFLDSRNFSTLSFWIRGQQGNERVLLKLADADWEEREDAVPLGEVSGFLPSGHITTEWQQGVVPLERFPAGIRRDMLALVVLEVVATGTSTIEIGTVAFSLSRDMLPALPEPAVFSQPRAIQPKATWIWNTEELLEDPDQLISLLGFLDGEGIDRVFLQIPGTRAGETRPGELTVDSKMIRPLVSLFTARGIRVYALDGFARYALPEYHAGVLGTIDEVARYNQNAFPHERFYGVRHDIEPYLLPGFHGPNRERLLVGLLQLVEASVARAHVGGLVYGADIPFWYDVPSEETFEPIEVVFRGVEKPLSEHIIDLADDVAIMDYRTIAYGADGTIRHGSGELEYAEENGKSVFIGLETHPVPDEVLIGFGGEPEAGFPSLPPPGPLVVLASARDSVHAVYLPDSSARPGALDSLATWIERESIHPQEVWWWAVSNRTDVPAEKITFANQDLESLRRVMRATAEEFRTFRSFAGFAIHHSESYRALVGG